MYRLISGLLILSLILIGCSSIQPNENNDINSKQIGDSNENEFQNNTNHDKDKNENTKDDGNKELDHDTDHGTDESKVNNNLNKQENDNKMTKYVVEDNKSIEDNIESILGKMTLEEKVGQLFIIDANSLNNKMDLIKMSESGKELLQSYQIGGIIFFKNNIVTIEQTKKLILDLQKSSDIPLFISVDEEGGLVSRIAKNPDMHATVLPNSKVIGDTKDPSNAYNIGIILGREIASLGFNMDFAPVADVNTNPANPVIGVRAYGSEEQLVGEMVYQGVLGIQDQNVSAVIKHFPGHGDTTNDTHTGSVSVSHDIDRLREVEFVPFKRGIEASVDGVMIAHIKVPAIDKENVEASLSKEIVTNLLRNELGYDGLVITDALNMGAISEVYGAREACIKAINAGVDILLMPIPFEEGYKGVIESVQNGVITEERINESVRRILNVKIKRKLFEENVQKPEEILGSEEHLELLESIKK